MAQTHNASHDASTLWAQSASRAKYAVHEGKPLIGISPDKGDGYIVPLPAPDWFASIADEGTRDNVFRAMASHALRVGQAKIKSADKPDREIAVTAVASALNGGYKPGRDTTNDIVQDEANRMFGAHVRNLVLAAKPDATEAQITATIAKQAETDKGKALLSEMYSRVIAAGTYTVQRKSSKTADALELAL